MPDAKTQTTAAIVVPCYNEEARLPVALFLEFAGSHDHVFFVFVNDGSTDKTGLIINSLCEASPQNISAIHFEEQRWQSRSGKNGYVESPAEENRLSWILGCGPVNAFVGN
jgi:dolichyl-phosphate beta-glucosyltransferase